jgi:hypothetical protein
MREIINKIVRELHMNLDEQTLIMVKYDYEMEKYIMMIAGFYLAYVDSDFSFLLLFSA